MPSRGVVNVVGSPRRCSQALPPHHLKDWLGNAMTSQPMVLQTLPCHPAVNHCRRGIFCEVKQSSMHIRKLKATSWADTHQSCVATFLVDSCQPVAQGAADHSSPTEGSPCLIEQVGVIRDEHKAEVLIMVEDNMLQQSGIEQNSEEGQHYLHWDDCAAHLWRFWKDWVFIENWLQNTRASKHMWELIYWSSLMFAAGAALGLDSMLLVAIWKPRSGHISPIAASIGTRGCLKKSCLFPRLFVPSLPALYPPFQHKAPNLQNRLAANGSIAK